MYCLYRLTTCWHQTEELSQTQNWAPLNLAELLRGHRARRWVRLQRLYADSVCTLLNCPTGKPQTKRLLYLLSKWRFRVRRTTSREDKGSALGVQRCVLWKIEVILKLDKGASGLGGNNKRVRFMERHLVHSSHFLQMKRKKNGHRLL